MRPDRKLEVLRAPGREQGLGTFDAFHEGRLRHDLQSVAHAPSLFARYVERARIRFQKASERAVLEHWIQFYETGARLISARTEMERRKSEYLQLSREHEVKEAEKGASLAKLHADIEESDLRREKAAYQRQHLERFVEGGTLISENERQLNEADARRQLDCKWELRESMRGLQTLIELQHWRRQQRDAILGDRSLSPEEQSEDLRFVDGLYQEKRAGLLSDVRVFEES